jgi:thiol-disulfide isomerase/thioredoxin
LFPIEKRDDLVKILDTENPKLTIVDLHLGWCGPCDAMALIYSNIWFSFD